MDRRQVLKLLTSAAFLPAFSFEALSVFRTVHAQIAQTPGLRTLNPQQNATVITITELIIPQTDTLGAKGVKVNEFIDLILTEWCDEADTKRFLSGLAEVDARSQKQFGQNFVECSEAQQTSLLKTLDDESMTLREKIKAADEDSEAPTNFFEGIKKLTLIGYYTSEVGFEDELHRSIIPPGHAGCAPISAEIAN